MLDPSEHDFNYVRPPGKSPRSYRLLDEAAVKEVEYLKAIERHFVSYLAARYKSGESVDIARLCDEKLDQSGRLLGRVRDVANGVKGWEPLDPVGPQSKPQENASE